MKKKSISKRDPFESAEFIRWADEMREKLIPNMQDSRCVMMIAPRMDGKFDINFALQVGAAILLEKPVILVVHRGLIIPPKLRAIADRIIEADLDNMTMNKVELQKQIGQAMTDLSKQ